MPDFSQYEIKERRSKVVPLNAPLQALSGGTKMVQVGQQWNAVYAVPVGEDVTLPKKADIAPGFALSDKSGLSGEELENAKRDDLFVPRVKDVQPRGTKDGKNIVVLHIAQYAPYEGV